jgi:hypothetical protein
VGNRWQHSRRDRRLRGLLLQDDSDAFRDRARTVLVGRHPHLSRWQWESAQDVRIAREALAAADMAGTEARRAYAFERAASRRARRPAQQPRLFLLDEPSSHLDLSHQLMPSSASPPQSAQATNRDHGRRRQPCSSLLRSRAAAHGRLGRRTGAGLSPPALSAVYRVSLM